jgi:hypothetical protein
MKNTALQILLFLSDLFGLNRYFRARNRSLVFGLPCLFEFVKNDDLGQHISPVTIGHILYSFDQNDMEIGSLYTIGPQQPIWIRAIQKSLNVLYLQFLKAIKSRRSHSCDFYLYRLTNSQLYMLMADLILVIVARKNSETISK